jgi:hypothetical protein
MAVEIEEAYGQTSWFVFEGHSYRVDSYGDDGRTYYRCTVRCPPCTGRAIKIPDQEFRQTGPHTCAPDEFLEEKLRFTAALKKFQRQHPEKQTRELYDTVANFDEYADFFLFGQGLVEHEITRVFFCGFTCIGVP